jgi:hypothetical protein
MALEKGVNSYVTLVEAEDFFENRIDVAAWASAANPTKEQALVTATMILDTYEWVGTALDSEQLLCFPRFGVYFSSRLGYSSLLPETVPQEIIISTCELAYHLLNNDGLLDDTGTVTDVSIGSITLKIKSDPRIMPNSVKRHIKHLLANGSNLWWRAN